MASLEVILSVVIPLSAACDAGTFIVAAELLLDEDDALEPLVPEEEPLLDEEDLLPEELTLDDVPPLDDELVPEDEPLFDDEPPEPVLPVEVHDCVPVPDVFEDAVSSPDVSVVIESSADGVSIGSSVGSAGASVTISGAGVSSASPLGFMF